MGNSEEFTVEQLARKVGLSRHGIRFYIQRGLLPPPEFHGAATRYTALHYERLLDIRRMQDELGLTLDGVARALSGKLDVLLTDPPYGESIKRATSMPTHWERWVIAPGLELHVSSDAPNDSRRLATRLRRDASPPTKRKRTAPPGD